MTGNVPNMPQFPDYSNVQQASSEAQKNVQEWLNQQAELNRQKEEAEAESRRQAAYKAQQQSSQQK